MILIEFIDSKPIQKYFWDRFNLYEVSSFVNTLSKLLWMKDYGQFRVALDEV